MKGDSAYPEIVDYETPSKLIKLEESLQELQEKIKQENGTLHRLEVVKGSVCQSVITHNYVPPYQHVLPATTNVGREKTNSHL